MRTMTTVGVQRPSVLGEDKPDCCGSDAYESHCRFRGDVAALTRGGNDRRGSDRQHKAFARRTKADSGTVFTGYHGAPLKNGVERCSETTSPNDDEVVATAFDRRQQNNVDIPVCRYGDRGGQLKSDHGQRLNGVDISGRAYDARVANAVNYFRSLLRSKNATIFQNFGDRDVEGSCERDAVCCEETSTVQTPSSAERLTKLVYITL